MKIEEKIITGILGGLAIGSIGYFTGKNAERRFQEENTPEIQIQRLQAAKEEKEAAEKRYREAYDRDWEICHKNEQVLQRLKETEGRYKREVKDSLRPEVEKEVRKELKTYIEKADIKYNHAEQMSKRNAEEKEKLEAQKEELTRQQEIVDLKYSFCKTYAENMKVNGYTINFMSNDEDLDDVESAVDRDYDYGDAVAAISNSSMSSNQKVTAIGYVDTDRDSDYYKAVIAVANSKSMSSYDKQNAIEGL